MSTSNPRRTRVKTEGEHVYRRYDGRWEIGLRLPDVSGQTKLRWIGPFDTPQEARDERDKRLGDKARHVKVASNPRLTFNEAADAWWEGSVLAHRKGQTIPTYGAHLRHLRREFGARKLSAISVHDIAAYFAKLDAAEWTKWGRRTVLSGVFDYARRHMGHSENPVKALHRDEAPKAKSVRKHRILTPAETDALLANASDWDRPLLALIRRTGLRKGEALGLTRENLNLSEGFLTVERQLDRAGNRVQPKTENSVRTIVLDPDTVLMLRKHLMSVPTNPDNLVFTRRDGACYTHPAADYALRMAAKGIDGLAMHDLRHTHASELISLGWDAVRVAARLGDTVETVLKVYAHEFDRARHAETERNDLAGLFGNAVESSPSQNGAAVLPFRTAQAR